MFVDNCQTREYNIQSTSFADASEILTIKEATEKYPEFPIIVATVDNWNESMLHNCEGLSHTVFSVSIKFYNELITQKKIISKLDKLSLLEKKLSMPENIWTNGNVKFYVQIILLILSKEQLWKVRTFF